MALPTEWQTQLWAAVQRLQVDGNLNVHQSQTPAPPTQYHNPNNANPNPNFHNIHNNQHHILNNVNYYLTNNYSTESFDALDLELACYNEQSLLGHLLTMILYALVCIVGLFGNTLVIYVVLRYSKMQTVTNIYILNLAIADECFLIGIPFLLYTMQMGSWKFGEYMCKAYMVSTSITQFTSSIFLLIMAADRYIAVCHPISSPRYRTPFVSKIVSCIAWLTSAVFMLPVILFANSVQIGDHVSCNIKWPESHKGQSDSTFIWYTLALGFALPLALITGFYFLVIRKLHSVELKHKSKEKKRSHRKVTKLVLTVIAVYVLCWTPYWIGQLVLISTNVKRCATALEILVFLMIGCLGYSNSAMNPLLYAFLSDNFKKSFLRAFSCAGRKKDGLTGEGQVERSILPKWGKRGGHGGVGGGGAGGGGHGGGGGNAGVGGGAGAAAGDQSQFDEGDFSGIQGDDSDCMSARHHARRYSSNPSHFMGTSTAGGTGMTATSIVDDPNSDITPMEPVIVDGEALVNIEAIVEKCSYGNNNKKQQQESAVNGIKKVRPPVLQTDL